MPLLPKEKAWLEISLSRAQYVGKIKAMKFDKRQAIDVIEDSLTDIATPYGRGVATGICGAFHMCGLIDEEEWEVFLDHISEGSDCSNVAG